MKKEGESSLADPSQNVKNGYKVTKQYEDIVLEPIEGHQYTLIWLHGLGDSPKSFVDIFACKVPVVPKVLLLNVGELLL